MKHEKVFENKENYKPFNSTSKDLGYVLATQQMQRIQKSNSTYLVVILFWSFTRNNLHFANYKLDQSFKIDNPYILDVFIL